MKIITKLNYEVTKKRGLITEETSIREFVMKLEEEVQEFICAALHEKGDFNHELGDIILVCLNIAKHYDVDIEKQLLTNIFKNMKR